MRAVPCSIELETQHYSLMLDRVAVIYKILSAFGTQ